MVNTGFIYFSKEAMQKVMDKVKQQLKEDGEVTFLKKNDIEVYNSAHAINYLLDNSQELFNKKAEEFRKAGNDTLADLYALVGSAATKEVGPEELAAIAASNVLNTPEGKEAADEIIEALTGLVKTVGSTFGGINSIFSFFDNLINKKNKKNK